MNLIAVFFVICCVALILIILIQKGRGGGLSAAFGGGMASGILGSKTGDFLTWVTIVLVGVMLTFAVILAKYYKNVIPDDVGTIGTQQVTPQSTVPSEGSTSEPEDKIEEEAGAVSDIETILPEIPVTEENKPPVADVETVGENSNESEEVNLPAD